MGKRKACGIYTRSGAKSMPLYLLASLEQHDKIDSGLEKQSLRTNCVQRSGCYDPTSTVTPLLLLSILGNQMAGYNLHEVIYIHTQAVACAIGASHRISQNVIRYLSRVWTNPSRISQLSEGSDAFQFWKIVSWFCCTWYVCARLLGTCVRCDSFVRGNKGMK